MVEKIVEVSMLGLIVSSVVSFIWWSIIFNVVFWKTRNALRWNKTDLEPTWWVLARNIITSFVSKVIQVNVLIYIMTYASVFYEWTQTISFARWIEAWLRSWLWLCVVSYLNDILRDNNPQRKIFMINSIWSLVMIILPIITYILLQNI